MPLTATSASRRFLPEILSHTATPLGTARHGCGMTIGEGQTDMGTATTLGCSIRTLGATTMATTRTPLALTMDGIQDGTMGHGRATQTDPLRALHLTERDLESTTEAKNLLDTALQGQLEARVVA